MSVEGTPTSGDMLGMSDDEFLNKNGPPEAGQEPAKEEDNEQEPVVQDPAPAEAVDPNAEPAEDESAPEEKAGEEKPAEVEPEAKAEGDAEKKAPEGVEPEKKPEASPTGSETEGVVAEPTAEQAAAFYKQVMAPFKANGKMIQLKDPSEVIQLMQMGANYTRKLQDIQPHRKVLLMLQNNDLLDEGKLSYLIDLDKKNPEAIKKLIKDAGIDPMDIDTSVEPTYLEGNHRVTDEEAGFRQVLDEVSSTQTGMETVRLINTDWDQASKEVLWKSPEIMSIIHEQRELGVYDLITTEMDRQKTLGQIPPNTPFLQAYKTVGDQLAAAGALDGKEPEKVPVATTKAAPKNPVTNGDKANAASPTRTTPRKAEKLVNPLAMSDEEFLSSMSGRL